MKTVVSLGESLIDLVAATPGHLSETDVFERAPGGAPANVAAAVARLGGRAAFVGKRGADPFGDCIEQTLRAAGVDTRYFLPTNDAKTGLAFVSLRPDGERSFLFYRDPSADMLLEPADVPVDFIAQSGVLHIGSVSMAQEPARAATIFAAQAARARGVWVSFDPNWRPPLWPNPEEGRAVILSVLPLCDMVKVNREELLFLAGTEDVEAGARFLHAQGPRLVVITLDKDGCYYAWRPGGSDAAAAAAAACAGYVPGIPVSCVDTTGAGDAFVGALLFHIAQALAEAGTGAQSPSTAPEAEAEAEEDGTDGPLPHRVCPDDHLHRIIAQRLPQWAAFAVAASALVTLRKGAIPALPTRDEVLAFARERGGVRS
ncbi:hypothetical protein GCM10010885_21590 [Alicyclobacillus cellulosilyticus]|uniref:Carbohydrate kinase PfkB domain-containing protein n=1 Tax=Alicyclobacillus cellulosilyticus TaxID=1003997 RepID=A0A917KHJ6_9BACL|nr:carbohydrate kinase [Alicyclobacillus cellulosilyticus]GGJ11924.1 hypothetical protein GCM10010885_21590 [Alicyclobacillus cellulosilyticus]